jgi:ectoine hydroxylase-related dioxygenase (phytanoyl-CoA dioxygenase family)
MPGIHRDASGSGAGMTSTTEPTLLAEGIVRDFERDGFVVVPDLLTRDELDDFGAAVTAAVTDRTRNDTTPLEQKSRYQQSFVQCMNLWEDHPEVAPLVFHPRVGQAAAELLRVRAVRLWHDQALVKRAGGRVTDPHQDHPYWPIKETASVTAWIPFAGSTAASGAMSYLPGSHAIGLRKFVNIFFGEPEDLLADPEVAGIEPVLVEVPGGSVAFHHGLTVHLAVRTPPTGTGWCRRSSTFPTAAPADIRSRTSRWSGVGSRSAFRSTATSHRSRGPVRRTRPCRRGPRWRSTRCRCPSSTPARRPARAADRPARAGSRRPFDQVRRSSRPRT